MKTGMSAKSRLVIALVLTGAVWLGIFLKLGLWRFTVTPADGHLSRTFDGWATYPASHHLFLMEFEPGDFAVGKLYDSASYPFIFFNYLYLAPFHFLLG